MLVLSLPTLAALVAPSRPGAAAEEGELVCTGPLPFSRAELAEALRARRPLLGPPSRIEVQADDSGRTLVRVGAAERQVDWGGRSGEEAARLVAVLAEDLAQADAPITVAAQTPGPSLTRTRRALRVGATLQSPFDQDGATAHLEPTVDVTVDVTRGFAAYLAAGYRRVAAGTDFRALTLQEVPVRAGAAYRRGWFELRLAGLLRPYAVGGAGAYRGLVWGGAMAAAGRWPLGRRLQLVLAAGLDVLASRALFSVNEQPILSTAWLAPWVGAGVAWEISL